MLQSESCVSFEVHYWQCFKIILNFYIKFFGNSNAIMNYFFLQFIYKFISMTLFSTQPNVIWQLRSKEFLTNKRKVAWCFINRDNTKFCLEIFDILCNFFILCDLTFSRFLCHFWLFIDFFHSWRNSSIL